MRGSDSIHVETSLSTALTVFRCPLHLLIPRIQDLVVLDRPEHCARDRPGRGFPLGRSWWGPSAPVSGRRSFASKTRGALVQNDHGWRWVIGFQGHLTGHPMDVNHINFNPLGWSNLFIGLGESYPSTSVFWRTAHLTSSQKNDKRCSALVFPACTRSVWVPFSSCFLPEGPKAPRARGARAFRPGRWERWEAQKRTSKISSRISLAFVQSFPPRVQW